MAEVLRPVPRPLTLFFSARPVTSNESAQFFFLFFFFGWISLVWFVLFLSIPSSLYFILFVDIYFLLFSLPLFLLEIQWKID